MAHPVKTDRIVAIDALRAFALLGILLIHTVENFDFFEESLTVGPVDNLLNMVIGNLFHNRSNAIFALLFGCSFWFLLRNPLYPSCKFVWRCVLLVGIGVIAKVFYTYDILMWYGLCGVMLVSVRRCPPRALLAIALILLMLSPFVAALHPGKLIFPQEMPARYISGYTMREVLDYPLIDSVKTSLVSVLDNLSLRTLGLMVLGYWFGQKGYIMRWKEIVTTRLMLTACLITILMFAFVLVIRDDGTSRLFLVSAEWLFSVQALFMAILFLWLCRKTARWQKPLACYGRLGLTNYFFQGIVGVTLTCMWFIPYGMHLTLQIAVMLAFFGMQMLFSIFWCRTHRNGPLEYLWRKATSIIPNRN
ncbi:MAG: DUF418 domain-containing protein [Muribaculaceae bacterium]|nr:DUF418 domain-containing protein [Muribaculaceae bacterium]